MIKVKQLETTISGRMICVAVIHGCGIGYKDYKYYARYTDCQRKNEILQCSLNN